MISVQGVELDAAARRVWRDGLEIRMSNKEFDLLHALIDRAGEIVSREDLMRDVWQTTFWTSAKTIDVHLGWVRKKLHDDPRRPTLITTIRGRGLRFELAAPVYAEVAPSVPLDGGPVPSATTISTPLTSPVVAEMSPVPVAAQTAS